MITHQGDCVYSYGCFKADVPQVSTTSIHAFYSNTQGPHCTEENRDYQRKFIKFPLVEHVINVNLSGIWNLEFRIVPKIREFC